MVANNVFELLMMISFGAAWPFSIYKSVKAKTAKGQSVIFLFVLNVGYICGMVNKVVKGVDYVLYFYIINFIMVSVGIMLYYRNRKYDMVGKLHHKKRGMKA